MYSEKKKVIAMFCTIVIAMVYTQVASGDNITGNGTANYIPKFTGTATIGNSVMYETGGKIGIGTVSPGRSLHIYNSASAAGVVLETTLSDYMLLAGAGSNDIGIYDRHQGNALRLIINSSGDVGIGTNSPTEKLTVRGNILVQRESTGTTCLELGEGLDYAEGFNITENKKVIPGAVLVIDADNPGNLTLSTEAYDTKVAGIVAGAKGVGSGVRLGVDQFDRDVALAGRVYCNVDATQYEIKPGDLLTTSDTSGYAMKAVNHVRARGAILGKAMQSLEKGKKDQILVLVTLQ